MHKIFCFIISLIFFFIALAEADDNIGIKIMEPIQDMQYKDSILVKVKIDETDIRNDIFVTAVITYPAGATEKFSLNDDGLLDDDRPSDMIFTKNITGLRVPGRYKIIAKAWMKNGEKWSTPVGFILNNTNSMPNKQNFDLILYLVLIILLLVISILLLLKIRKYRQIIEEKKDTLKTPDTSPADDTKILESLQKIEHDLESINNSEEEISNLRVKLEANNIEIESWRKIAIEYFETLERGLELFDSNDDRRALIKKNADVFARYCESKGLYRILPNPGDPLVDGLYQVAEEEQSDSLGENTIIECIEWGYKSDNKVYKLAKVVVSSNK